MRESLLMTFEKWMMDSIKNNIDGAKYAPSKENLLAVFDFVYRMCYNVSAWGSIGQCRYKISDICRHESHAYL